jgi:hypothetical protein
MGWECGRDGDDKGCIQNFGGEPLLNCSLGRVRRWVDNVR